MHRARGEGGCNDSGRWEARSRCHRNDIPILELPYPLASQLWGLAPGILPPRGHISRVSTGKRGGGRGSIGWFPLVFVWWEYGGGGATGSLLTPTSEATLGLAAGRYLIVGVAWGWAEGYGGRCGRHLKAQGAAHVLRRSVSITSTFRGVSPQNRNKCVTPMDCGSEGQDHDSRNRAHGTQLCIERPFGAPSRKAPCPCDAPPASVAVSTLRPTLPWAEGSGRHRAIAAQKTPSFGPATRVAHTLHRNAQGLLRGAKTPAGQPSVFRWQSPPPPPGGAPLALCQ